MLRRAATLVRSSSCNGVSSSWVCRPVAVWGRRGLTSSITVARSTTALPSSLSLSTSTSSSTSTCTTTIRHLTGAANGSATSHDAFVGRMSTALSHSIQLTFACASVCLVFGVWRSSFCIWVLCISLYS
jgi:hypothetical protein